MEVEEDAPAVLVFDEERASRTRDYATNVAKVLGMPHDKVQELEQVAYYYNIGMDNGKFVGEKDKVLVPYKAVRIRGGAPSWTISNPENIVYSFKQNERSTISVQHMPPHYTSAWGVEKITSPHNHTITYEYQFDGYYVSNSASSCEGYYHSYIDIPAPWYGGFDLNKNYTIPLKKIFIPDLGE